MYCISQVINNENKEKKFRIMTYNVENFFDYRHDSTLEYNEFSPMGVRGWNKGKYIKKRNSIYKVIRAVGEWEPVTLVGLIEVENSEVVYDLINSTPLGRDGYDFVHYDSDDKRGIDVALIYHKKSFSLISSYPHKVIDPMDDEYTTRDLLYVKGILGSDTLHLIIAHWTSRYRGVLKSEYFRKLASATVLKITDSLYHINNSSRIIVMGDFNDSPYDESVSNLCNLSKSKLRKIKFISIYGTAKGTMKYKESWKYFDQFLVSESLLDSSKLFCHDMVNVFDPDFLLAEDNRYLGYKPKRTYIGYSYNGGTSDHLPIFIDLKVHD